MSSTLPLPPAGYRELALGHREEIGRYLAADPPLSSELTFTNLFIWRHHYRPLWRVEGGFLLLICHPPDQEPFALRPVGSGDPSLALEGLVRDLEGLTGAPSIRRVEGEFVERLPRPERFLIQEDPANSDYVYLARDLIELKGRKYEKKRGHLHRFLRNQPFEYAELTQESAGSLLDLQETWCRIRDCQADPELVDEDRAVFEALTHFPELGFAGGLIRLRDRVEAFSLGERLNPRTAVIHIEKANPGIDGLYAAINQRFAQEAWSGVEFINREQDLGLPNLKKAKLSYHPHHQVIKYTLTPV